MSIAHELSCDVAAAILAEQVNPPETTAADLSEIVLAVHSTLRQMTTEARTRKRRATANAINSSQSDAATASSSH